MSTKVEIRRVMFDYEKISEMIVNELDFAVSDDNVPENKYEDYVKYLINRSFSENIEKRIEIRHLDNVEVWMNKGKNMFEIFWDDVTFYEMANYCVEEQVLSKLLPDYEEVYIDNEKYTPRKISSVTILRKIREETEKYIENEYYKPKKLEKIMKVFYKVCGDESYQSNLENKIIELL